MRNLYILSHLLGFSCHSIVYYFWVSSEFVGHGYRKAYERGIVNSRKFGENKSINHDNIVCHIAGIQKLQKLL